MPVRNAARVTRIFAEGFTTLQKVHGGFFNEIRQNGLIIGLGFDHPEGARFVSRALYENGVWAIFSTLDPRILQFKPGVLMTEAQCADVLERLDTALGQAREAA